MALFNDADDFFETSAAAGNAMRFKDIDGIGPKTASKITNIRGVRNPDDVADMSADELSDKAGISTTRASKAIKAGGGNPSVSKQGNTGTVSAAGMMMPRGDFRVEATDMDTARAKNDARSRSREAVRQDDRKRAPVTTDLDKWKNNKSKYDFPGVDTPTQNPDLLPKDLKAGSPRTNNFEARDRREAEEKRQSYPRKTSDARGNENAILETGDDRIAAGQVMREVPDGTIPGVAPQDFEDDQQQSSYAEQSMGFMPSAQRAPRGWLGDLATEAPDRALAQPENPKAEQVPFGQQLQETREERGNLFANQQYWEKQVEKFEENEVFGRDLGEVTSIAGQVVVELDDSFDGQESNVDAVATGLTEYGAPVKSANDDYIRIDASREDRPIPFREREKSITGRFAEER